MCHELAALNNDRPAWFLSQRDFPSSFKGFHGKIAYLLEAKISRSWRVPSSEHKELRFVSMSVPPLGPATVGEISWVKLEESVKHQWRF